MNSSQRILEYVNLKGISKREFYKNTGLSNGYLDKTENLGANKLAKVLAAYPDLNLYYVVAGIGTITNNKMITKIKKHKPALHLINSIASLNKRQLPGNVQIIEQASA